MPCTLVNIVINLFRRNLLPPTTGPLHSYSTFKTEAADSYETLTPVII
jgi:hypothetical protein